MKILRFARRPRFLTVALLVLGAALAVVSPLAAAKPTTFPGRATWATASANVHPCNYIRAKFPIPHSDNRRDSKMGYAGSGK